MVEMQLAVISPSDLPEHIARRIVLSDETFDGSPCWRWTGYHNVGGYGRIVHDGQDHNVHRVTYALLVGPIPAKYSVHHRCERTWCASPLHLQVLTTGDHKRVHSGWVRDEQGEWIAKPCRVCNQTLPLSSFHVRNTGVLAGNCKSCVLKRAVAWASANRARQNENNRRYRERKRAAVNEVVT